MTAYNLQPEGSAHEAVQKIIIYNHRL